MKRNGIELLKIIAAILLFAAGILFISFQISQNQKVAETIETQQESKLAIAVVNEDQGGEFEGQEYELGKNYVTHLSKDLTNEWTLTTRSVAEKGLESGDYQLVVYIPSNFSQKVVDINATAPEQATITYKVNSNGNATIENMANQVGNRIVTELDQQLVGVFMASILNNLYQAQQNVKAVVDTQAVNIGNYQSTVVDVAGRFRSSLPNLLTSAQASASTNNQLINSLSNSVSLFDGLSTSQTDFSTSLTDLMAQREAGTTSYGEFVSQLLTMNNLVGQTQDLYSQIRANQVALGTGLSVDDPGTLEIEGLRTAVTDLQSKKGQLSKQIDEATASVIKELAIYYGIDTTNKSTEEIEQELDQLTLKEFIARYAPGTNLESDLATAKTELSVITAQLIQAQTALTTYETRLSQEVKSGRIQLPSGQYNGATVTVVSNSPDIAILTPSFTLSGTASAVDYQYRVTAAPSSPSSGATITVTITLASTGSGNTSGMSSRTGEATIVPLTSSSSTDPSSSSSTSGSSSTDPSTDPSASTDPSSSTSGSGSTTTPGGGTTVTPPATANTLIFEDSADYSSYASIEYQNLVDRRNKLRTQEEAQEKLVATQEKLVNSLNDPVVATLKQNIKNAFLPIKTNLDGNATTTASVEASIANLSKQIDAVEAQTLAGYTEITNLLNQYEQQVGSQAASVLEAQTSDEANQTGTTSALSALSPAFSSLTSASQSARDDSASNVTSAESVRDLLTNFEGDISEAESTTDNLATDATSLSTAFNDELSKNQDFVGSFVKVLNNAYNNGVPNEELLKFLSSPITQSAQATRATANVYKPFTWVLLMAIMGLFTAYLFSNSQVFQTTMNKFSTSENAFLRAGSKTVIVSQMLTLILGLTIGVLSLDQLQISGAYSVLWVFSVIAMTMFLAQWLYLILKHFKAFGMGVALFILISYIYLTSAIGTTASLSGLPLVMRNINILSIFENLLSGFFIKEPIALWQVFLIMVGLAIGVILGIFVKEKQVEEN